MRLTTSLLLIIILLLPSLAQPDEDLTVEQAVALALRQNPAMAALAREVDLAEAERLQASRLVNPVFSASVRFPEGGGPLNTEFGLSWNLLDLLRRGQRDEVASMRVRQERLELEDQILALTFEVREAFYQLQLLRQSVDQLDIVAEAADAATELHRRQFQAGNIPEVALAQQQAAQLEARIQAEQARFRRDQACIRLNTLLGRGPGEAIQVARLSDLPESDALAPDLEALALRNRPDLKLAELEVEADRRSLALESGGLLDEVSFGVSREAEPEAGGVVVTGPELEFPVPLFDRRQGQVARFRAKIDQSQRLLESGRQRARAEVLVAASQLRAARLRVERLSTEMIPKRRQILLLSRPYYDSMLLGVYPLLQMRQDLARARLELLEALADYWTARAHLERELGGPCNVDT